MPRLTGMEKLKLWQAIGLFVGMLLSRPCVAELSLLGGYALAGSYYESSELTRRTIGVTPVYAIVLEAPLGAKHQALANSFVGAYFSHMRADASDDEDGQEQALDLAYAHFISSKRWSEGPGQTYLGVGTGMTWLSSEYQRGVARFSVSLGGGYLWQLSRGLDLRFDFRLLGTFFNSRTRISCSRDCVIQTQANSWGHGQLTLGINFRF